ncbi:MAG TPA: caspase family protein [Pyrinomonadaceae bacterium]|nr:caspase family protein [Pyrinomonadaceae bacterium]
MKAKTKLLRALSILAALACALALPHAPSSSAQLNSRGLNIKAEDGKDIKLYDKSYALVIGVSDYAAGWPKLPGVKKDIEEVARALESHGFQVTKVENPDSAQLDKAFKTFIDLYGLGVENRLLFYFAGHGHTVKQSYGEEMGYIVPVDAPNPTRDPAGFMSKAMDMQQMELYARRIQSKHALFLFDSCFSGALFALSRAVPDSIGYKTARPVRQFITSGSADEQVPDQSIFRRQFVEAIEGEADGNRDGYVTGTELGEFLQDKVVNYSRNAQHPQYGKIRNPNLDKGDFVFALPKKTAPPAVAVKPNTSEPASPAPARVDPVTVELAFWDAIKSSNDPEDYKEYLSKYPNGQFAGIARRRAQATAEAGDASAKNVRPNDSSGVAESVTFFPIRVHVRADNANNGWTDSGIFLSRGQKVRITATGRISLGKGRFSTAAGLPLLMDTQKLIPTAPTGALIAVISDDNNDFIFIGASGEFVAQRDGRLFLGVNEGNLDDNSGTYDVLIEGAAVTP